MKLSVSDIRDRVGYQESKRAQYKRNAVEWEDAWRLKAFDRSPRQAIEQDGQEQVTLPIPFNVVNLASRLISTTPKIDVPPADTTEEADSAAELCEKWLNAMWQKVSRDGNRNIIADAIWWSLVRGRFVFEAKWVGDVLPAKMKKRRLPISVRTLDPLNCGFKQGPLYTEYAYHKYRDDRLNVLQRYPKLKLDRKPNHRYDNEDEEVEITDFWYVDYEDGSVWNAVVVEDEFAKKPIKTDYPAIPLIESYGDTTPLEAEEYRGMSILHPLVQTGLWRYQCRLASQMATGLLWYFWPAILVENEMGQAIDDIKVGPGITTNLPIGTRVTPFQINPNVPLSQAMDSRIDAEVQNSTFPGVMYGKAPGELSAGYGVSLLSDAAKGRIKAVLENLEFGIARVNEAVLGLVAEFGGSKGVDVWGMDERSGQAYRLSLTAKDIEHYQETVVSLKPVVPSDMTQRQTLGLRFVQDGIISRQTFRDKFLDVQAPTDEQKRVELEKVMQREDLQKILGDRTLEAYFGRNWQQKLGVEPPPPPQPPPGPPMPPGGPPPGMMGPKPPPPPPGPPPPIQPPGMGTPLGGGIPPEMAGQMTPELMGLPPDMDPIMMAQMMGQPLPANEEMNILAGLPQGGLPNG